MSASDMDSGLLLCGKKCVEYNRMKISIDVLRAYFVFREDQYFSLYVFKERYFKSLQTQDCNWSDDQNEAMVT